MRSEQGPAAMTGRWMLGAYAGYASVQQKSSQAEQDFWRGLKDLPALRGLELPFYEDLHPEDSDAFMRILPRDWDYILTLLPGTMAALQKNPDFGLASRSESGREQALQLCERARQRILQINEHCGRPAVLAVELHSAPTRSHGPDRSASAAFAASLESLRAKDWGGCEILIEHCDALRPGIQPVKGFLDLDDELSIAKRLGLRLNLNWGRSVIEERDGNGAIRHIQRTKESLAAFFFSGVTVDDPIYGSWLDNHAPLRLFSDRPWEAQGSLLSREAVEETLATLGEGKILGIKVQPAPASLSLDQRLEFLAQQVLAFEDLALRSRFGVL